MLNAAEQEICKCWRFSTNAYMSEAKANLRKNWFLLLGAQLHLILTRQNSLNQNLIILMQSLKKLTRVVDRVCSISEGVSDVMVEVQSIELAS